MNYIKSLLLAFLIIFLNCGCTCYATSQNLANVNKIDPHQDERVDKLISQIRDFGKEGTKTVLSKDSEEYKLFNAYVNQVHDTPKSEKALNALIEVSQDKPDVELGIYYALLE